MSLTEQQIDDLIYECAGAGDCAWTVREALKKRLTEEFTRLQQANAALVEKAEAFRVAMVESGALNSVSQDKYFPQLRALETALAQSSDNWRTLDDCPSDHHRCVLVQYTDGRVRSRTARGETWRSLARQKSSAAPLYWQPFPSPRKEPTNER